MADKTAEHKPSKATAPKRGKAADSTALVKTPSSVAQLAQQALADLASTSPARLIALQQTAGNRAVTRLIQTKLTVGPAGDQYEQEADRVAAQVMTMPAPAETQPALQRAPEEEEELQMKPLAAPLAAAITPLVQRAPEEEDELQMKPLVQREAAPEEEEELQMKPLAAPLAAAITPLVQRAAEEEEELQMKPLVQREAIPEEEEEIQMKPDVQRASSGAGFEVGGEFEQQLSASRGSGSPLPAEVRSFMEPRFGADFSGVRLHTGSDAAQLNREVSAQAFTHGQDIYLGAGKSDVASPTGKALLAHELTHTIQQGAVARKTDEEVQRSAELLMRMPDIQRLTDEEWEEIEAAGLKRTVHADERAIQRGIWASSIVNTYRRGTRYSDPDHPNATVYYSDVKHLMLAVSNDDQSLITAYRTFKPKAKWVEI